MGIYIGGVNRACAQANLTSGWLRTIQAEGWRYFPMYVGLQAPCVAGFGDATIKAGSAAAEGKAAADDAVTQAGDLGIPSGTPIIFDMEAYRGGCHAAVITFLSAWDSELHAKGYVAGIYESFSNIADLIGAAGQMTEPDVIHYADWDGHATTTSSYMPSNRWTSNQRIHQYQGGHNETWGGKTINIDNDQLDVALSGGAPPPPPTAGGDPAAGLPDRGGDQQQRVGGVVRPGRQPHHPAQLPAPGGQLDLVGDQVGGQLPGRRGQQPGRGPGRQRHPDPVRPDQGGPDRCTPGSRTARPTSGAGPARWARPGCAAGRWTTRPRSGPATARSRCS